MTDIHEKARELADSAPDKYLKESNLSADIVDLLKQNEQPMYIVKCPGGGFTLEDSPNSGGSILEKANEWEDNILLITNNRLLFVEENNGDKIRAEHLPYKNVSKFEVSAGGWFGISQIEIEVGDCSISSKIHKDMSDSRASSIMEYVLSSERNSPEWVNNEVDDVENALPMWYRTWIDVEVVANYGLGLSDSTYRLYISPRRLKLEPDGALVSQSESVEIESSEIQFDEIKMATERDFKKENRSRYINVINPVLQTDSETKKSKMRTIKIPLVKSNDYVIVSSKDSSGHNTLLNMISTIEPYADYHTSTTAQDVKTNDEGSDGEPLEILKKRLANGEITVEEFEERKDIIT